MKSILIGAALAGMVAVGSYAVAQAPAPQGSQTMQSDTHSNDTGNKPETMKQCMARQKATNSGLTHNAMETTCKNEMKVNKAHKEGNDLATGPQAGSKPPQD